MKNKHLGSCFDEFLEEEGILNEVEAAAIKRLLSHKIYIKNKIIASIVGFLLGSFCLCQMIWRINETECYIWALGVIFFYFCWIEYLIDIFSKAKKSDPDYWN